MSHFSGRLTPFLRPSRFRGGGGDQRSLLPEVDPKNRCRQASLHAVLGVDELANPEPLVFDVCPLARLVGVRHVVKV